MNGIRILRVLDLEQKPAFLHSRARARPQLRLPLITAWKSRALSKEKLYVCDVPPDLRGTKSRPTVNVYDYSPVAEYNSLCKTKRGSFFLSKQ